MPPFKTISSGPCIALEQKRKPKEKKEPRIGVFICHCGTNIAGSVDVKEVVEHASKLPNVVVAIEEKYVCSQPGQVLIRDS